MAERRPIEHDHALITGVTKCGKTTLAHRMANEEATKKKDRRPIIVYDPVGTETAAGTWPDGTIYFDDDEKFLEFMEKHEGEALVFIDEADDIMAHRFIENTRLVRRGRHFGWQIVLITQRPHLISPSARTQCGVAFVFRLAREDSRAIGQEFGHNDLHQEELDRGDFLVLQSGSAQYERNNVFTHSKGVLAWTESDTGSKSRRLSSSSSPSSTASRRSRGS